MLLELNDVSKSFGGVAALTGISFGVKQGEVFGVIGPNGAGKTTLLQILGTLDVADSGKLYIDGTDVSSLRERDTATLRNKSIGFVFQNHQLLPEFTALENVCMPALILGGKSKEAKERATELLHLLGLEHRLGHLPSELSGGECQRVAMARALMNKPRVVFADEPSGSLDSLNKEELHALFFKLRRELGQTFVLVTHDVSLAERADRMIELKDGLVERIWINPNPER